MGKKRKETFLAHALSPESCGATFRRKESALEIWLSFGPEKFTLLKACIEGYDPTHTLL